MQPQIFSFTSKTVRDVGRSENWEGPVLIGGHNLPTSLPKYILWTNPISVPGLSDAEAVEGGLWLDVDGGLWLEVEGGLWLAVGGLWLEVEGGLWLAAEGGLWLDPDDVGGLLPDTLAPEENKVKHI